MLTFNEAYHLYLSAKSQESGKRLSENTRIVRVDANTLAVRLHNTNVLCICNDGTYTLNSGGFRTRVTRDRLNRYGPANVTHKHHGEWHVSGYVFFDGIKLNRHGEVLNADPDLQCQGTVR